MKYFGFPEKELHSKGVLHTTMKTNQQSSVWNIPREKIMANANELNILQVASGQCDNIVFTGVPATMLT